MRFSLLVLLLAMAVHSSLAWVILLSRNRSSLSCRRCSVCLMCWRRGIFCCLQCSRGPGGMMVLLLSICCVGLGMLWWVGASGWESMAYALCNLGLGLGLSNFFVLLLPVTVTHLSLFSPSSSVLAHRQSSPDLLPSLAYLPNSSKFVVWLECHVEFVADQFEAVALVLLVPHSFVRFDLMGLLAMELLAVGARILFWLIVFVLLLFSPATA
jgi:hypothetical protein